MWFHKPSDAQGDWKADRCGRFNTQEKVTQWPVLLWGDMERQTGIENRGGHGGLPEVAPLYLGAKDELQVTQAKIWGKVLQAEGTVHAKILKWEPAWHFSRNGEKRKEPPKGLAAVLGIDLALGHGYNSS